MTTQARPAKAARGTPGGRGLRPLWVRGGARACAPASAGLLRTAIPPASSLDPETATDKTKHGATTWSQASTYSDRLSSALRDEDALSYAFVKQCAVCQFNIGAADCAVAIGSTRVLPTFDTVQIDFIGPLPVTPSGNRYVLTCVD